MPLAEQKGGCETMLLRFLRENKAGPNVDYRVGFLEDGPMVEQVKGMGYPVRVFEAGHMKELGKYFRTLWQMRDWMRSEGVAVSMAWMEKGQLYAGPAAFLARVLSVWWIHSIPKDQWMNVWATRLPCRAVFCVGTTAEKGQKTLSPLRPTYVPGIGIELSQFDPATLPPPAQARQMLGLPAHGPIIGMVARMQRWKGVHVFLDAAARIAKDNPDAHFVIVGGAHFDEPDYPGQLQKQVEDAGIAHRVTFAGFQSNVPVWMQAFDIFVHASENEPTGAVIVEALALGKCVVAARTEGPMELGNDETDALYVEPNQPDLLAQTLRRLLGDPALRERLQAAAPKQARKFGIDQLAVRVAGFLRDVAEHPVVKAGKA